MEKILVNREIAGKQYRFATGYMAKQANGAVFSSIENTEVLGVATMAKSSEVNDFFPLQVHYVEKFYAAGRIPGGYFRREAKPSDGEILICRMIDRPLRPLFPEGFRREVQIVCTVLSIDGKNQPDIMGFNAASAALTISDIPFNGPVGAVQIGHIDGRFVVNPSADELENSKMDLIVAGTKLAITMIEGDCAEFSEAEVLEAIELAHATIKEIVSLQEALREKVGKPKLEVEVFVFEAGLKEKAVSLYREKLKTALDNPDKLKRQDNVDALYADAQEVLAKDLDEALHGQIKDIIHEMEKEIVREAILEDEKRVDARGLNEIRPIECKVDVLKNVHGSALFTRGQTQALVISTLGSSKNIQRIDKVTGEITKNFMLHYNFPPYSVGETGRYGPTGRREIGHGMLAERSLARMVPALEAFNYTIRVVSEILESNGSSSMATICGGTLSMMAAGVPLKKPVAGIAMGLIMKVDKYKILTDIQGLEDHLGDMDFKVAGTRDGITGFQLDIKVEGITPAIMKEALAQAREARLKILDEMEEVITKPRVDLSDSAPKQVSIKIPVDKIRNVIGLGGKNIKAIIEETGSDIDIQDSGTCVIFAKNSEILEKTILLIERYTGVPKIGNVYNGIVRRITHFGAFIEIFPGTDGLCHVSEIAHERLGHPSDALSEGEKLDVKVIKIDDQGRVSLSRKVLI